jgi:lipopolysaccharide/colanic/teichoic acid biosynthesis glycosyltransferase/glycosyltransferase involved in cell wall biosynthesis
VIFTRRGLTAVIPLEHRFERTPDGTVWTRAAFAHDFWRRYLAVFDSVRVVARVQEVTAPPAKGRPASGERVAFAAVPYFVGPLQYLLRRRAVTRSIRAAIGRDDALILRVPGTIGGAIVGQLDGSRPFGVEVLGDPDQTFAAGAVNHPARPFFRWAFARSLRRLCSRAAVAAYVTDAALQRKYPSGGSMFAVSDVELGRDAFAASRSFRSTPRPLRLVLVGSLEQPYKGVDVLIDALAERALAPLALDAVLTVVGDGRLRPELEKRAKDRGLEGRIRFLGHLPSGGSVREALDAADVFVMPSRTEGLPRALIEAMARGLPCIASAVGGIPELLDPSDLVPVNDVKALARKLAEIAASPERLTAASARNFRRARDYREEVLAPRHTEFLVAVRRAAERWRVDQGERAGVNESRPKACMAGAQDGWRLAVKRTLDVTGALLLLLLLAPLLLVIAAAIRITLGPGVIFTQLRPGRGREIFRLFKFRTMTEAHDGSGRLLADEARLTPLGRFLRATSLDELPQLWNVLRGELSFVGPRPLLPEYLQHYSSEEARRHEVLPGITGWAQVNGRNSVAWSSKLALDTWYVDRWSLGLDLVILARTLVCVVARTGVSSSGHATGAPFLGSDGLRLDRGGMS